MARRFRRRGGMRRARGLIRRTVSTMGPIEAKRIVFTQLSIPARSSTVFDNPVNYDLIVAKDTVDEELESNGTTIAEVPNYSKVVGLKLNLMMHGGSGGDIIRWMLVKKPDGEDTIGTLAVGLADNAFHNSNDTTGNRELRANTLAKGFFIVTDRTGGRVNIFVKRKTLKRLGSLRENDKIGLYFAVSSATNSNVLTGFGTMYVRLT